MIHAADNEILCTEDKFVKISHLLNYLNKKFLELGAVFGSCTFFISIFWTTSDKTKIWGFKALVAASFWMCNKEKKLREMKST